MSAAMVWLVGAWREGAQWELQGVFSSADLALEACTERDWFVGPVPLDEILPKASTAWPGAHYPNADPPQQS